MTCDRDMICLQLAMARRRCARLPRSTGPWLQDGNEMAGQAVALEVLVIQFWIRDPDPIRRALASAGLDVHITRVDIEPSLNAALDRAGYAVVIYDPEAPG